MARGEISCWICGCRRAVQWKTNNGPEQLAADDLKITDARYGVTLTLFRCADCGFRFADPEEVGSLSALYAELVDDEYEDGREARRLQMQWLLQIARRCHPRARTALDIGAASGLLVKEGRDDGLEVVGVEPSASLVDAARRQHDVELVHGSYPHAALAGRRFDLVFAVDVIEHVDTPLALLEGCAAALADGGRAIVVTPDAGSLTARLMGKRWWHLRLAHIGLFDRRSFAEACRRAGLSIEREVRAQWFFPVDYLAERLERYLPVGWLNRLGRRLRPTRRLYAHTIALNLHDSSVFVLRRTGPA